MAKTTIAVLFGGVSSEHEVSRMSATSVLNNLDKEKFNVLAVGIKKMAAGIYIPAPQRGCAPASGRPARKISPWPFARAAA